MFLKISLEMEHCSSSACSRPTPVPWVCGVERCITCVFTGNVQRVQGLRPGYVFLVYNGALPVCLQVKLSVFNAYAHSMGLCCIKVYYLCVYR